jgi:hypothetical protein
MGLGSGSSGGSQTRGESIRREPLRHALAVGLGVVGGLMLNLEIAALQILLSGPSDRTPDSWPNSWPNSWIVTLGAVVWTLLLAAACTTLLLYRVQSAISVFKRGCAMGLVLWTAMLPLASGFASQLEDRSATHANDDWPFSALEASHNRDGAELLRTLVTTTSVVMIILCAACFAAIVLTQRSRARQPDPTRGALHRTA